MSPALLSKRLKELEKHKILDRVLIQKHPELYEYILTPSGKELQTVVEAIGLWGHRWAESDLTLDNLDPQLLMWDMRRNLKISSLPHRRLVIEFTYPELDKNERKWWLIVDPKSGADLCSVEPGFDIDLYVQTSLRVMTAIWMGMDTTSKAINNESLMLIGDKDVASKMQEWLGLSPFATHARNVP